MALEMKEIWKSMLRDQLPEHREAMEAISYEVLDGEWVIIANAGFIKV